MFREGSEIIIYFNRFAGGGGFQGRFAEGNSFRALRDIGKLRQPEYFYSGNTPG